ncbi:MAG: cytochrome c, partial [Thermoplasmata archaeon]|nr:cytochrome c [Thermoplasmata archaeon]
WLSEIRRYDPNNQAPSAVIGLPSSIECTSPSGATATASGTSSSDPDGDPLTYAWTAPGATVGSPTASSTLLTLPMGSTNVGLTVTDNWEHSGTASVTTTVADTTAPVTTADTTPTAGPGGWYSGSVSVSLSAADLCSASTSTYRSVDGGATTLGTTAFVSGAGVHTVAFHSVDGAGNVEATQTLTIRIDTVAPSVTLVDPAPGALYLLGVRQATPPLVTTIVGPMTLTATATDALSGVHHVEFLVDGAFVGSDSSAPYNFFWNNAGLLLPGLHTITARAVDQAGNTDDQTVQALVVPVP